ncbi:bifunctional Class II Aminoacyl-tRNA synthetase-Biotinyl protein ligase (BPL) and lipoyl protein ligase (LPL)/Phenylalanyl-tRNA synthetase [Babesia duncani]|uniref:phenylalanine--tRNA ligase n=1 Tax=Babesia duncani TaxID=323732 RepID=A0AAD9PKH4_9APIC|nr:bifunctional Class II Aminoacyl-tRNA synthetase-Biotinyl protein ligase (BPL) and lipoyl protein ligase (LPL)/Phenylalanyl-tRNA synthetase [Babesia duncani]
MASKEQELNVLLQTVDAAFANAQEFQTIDLATGKDHERLVAGVKSLMTRGYFELTECKYKEYTLTKEGSLYAENGSPEYNLLVYLRQQSLSINVSDALKAVDNADKGLRKLLKCNIVSMDSSKQLHVTRDMHADITCELLKALKEYGTKSPTQLEDKLSQIISDPSILDQELDDLKKRKLIQFHNLVYYVVKKGPNYQTSLKEQATDLTQEMLENGSWRNVGTLHPLVKTMNEFRDTFTAMGFEEIDTREYVESSFWCFDALFIPQQHPARDSQDTFFTRIPSKADMALVDEDYIKQIAAVHGDGKPFQSLGWQYEWKIQEAEKLVLRTHTTACSARLLRSLAKRFDEIRESLPRYFFSIDKVFRNESMDATHLAEFHQVEGFMVGEGLGLAHLIGVLSTFYKAIGIAPLKFKPTYNPYTEPSMEIYGYHTKLKTPEVMLPMGLPPHVKAVAWGLSLERPTMIREDIKNIRDLVGCNY